jgi:hypothetical protein
MLSGSWIVVSLEAKIRFVLVIFLVGSCCAYRVGDVVETELSIDSWPSSNVLRSQMPVFGVSTRAQFQIKKPTTTSDESSDRRLARKAALSFQDGLWGLPTIFLTNSRGSGLQKLMVVFLYSKSGNGVIHSVSCVPKYPDGDSDVATQDGVFRVEYKWVEEEEVDLNAGQAIMLLVSFLAGVFILVASCGLLHSPDHQWTGAGGNGIGQTSVPKWD